MKRACVSLLLLMGGLVVSAAEEMELSLYPYIRGISDEQREKWSPQEAIKALGPLPGAPTQATLDLLAESWKQPEGERLSHRHRQMEQLVKEGRTTDMNTYLLALSNWLWFNHLCHRDRSLYVNHLLSTYEQEHPQELPHRQNWLGAMSMVQDFLAEYLLGITEAQLGIPARLTEKRYNMYKMRQCTAAEINRLWSNPQENADYLMTCGTNRAKNLLRCLLHDRSVLYDKATRRGLSCWHYTWGKDLPAPLERGLQLMQQRGNATLPTPQDLQGIRDAAAALPDDMKAFAVRSMLAADSGCVPWKKLDTPDATPEEMPDCTAVLLPQWDDSLLGSPTSVQQDIAALEQLVQEEKAADRLSSLVLFTLAQDARLLPDYAHTAHIPTQGHFRYSSTFDVEVSENGIDILIDDSGPRFARNDEEMRRRSRALSIALHRCALQLALLERDGKTEEHARHCAALAELLNRQRLWPLLLSQFSLRHLGQETQVQLMQLCKADERVQKCMRRLFRPTEQIQEKESEEIAGPHSFRGYRQVRAALNKGDLPAAQALLSRMTADPKHYSYVGTRLAAALVKRAAGDETAAREQERYAITLAAICLNSNNLFYRADAHRLLQEHGLVQESEKLFDLLPGRSMRCLQPGLIRALAAQKRFRAAAFRAEFLLVEWVSEACPAQALGTHADVAHLRVEADVYRALTQLNEGQTEQGNILLERALQQLEHMPELARQLAPALLECADLPRESRRSIRERLFREADSQAPEIRDIPTVSERPALPAEALTPRPFDSPLYTWHLSKDTDTLSDDERYAATGTVQARLLSANYHDTTRPQRVILETEAGRRLTVPLEEIAADDLNNLIDWKQRNNIRTWNANEKKVYDTRPLEARLERYVQEPTDGSQFILHGVDVSDGRVAVFTTTEGTPVKLYVNMLDEESRKWIEEHATLEQRQTVFHSSLPAAEAEAKRRDDRIMAVMLGKRGGPEEQEFRRSLTTAEGKDLPATHVLLLCYRDEQGKWETAGQQVRQLIQREISLLDPPGTPEHDLMLDTGFAVILDHNAHLIAHRYRGAVPAEYKTLTAAISQNKVAEVTRLLDAHPELLHVRTVDYSGCCPLQVAIRSGRGDMAKLLLQRGASPNTRNYCGMTLLHDAIALRSPEMVRLLLEHGADPNRPTLEHHGAATYPLFAAQRKPNVLPLLPEHGARVDQLNEDGEHALFQLTAQAPEADFALLEANARLLVPKGLPLNLRNKRGESILFRLALCSTMDKYGKNPQRLAELLQAMKTLIELGADVQDTADGSPSLLSRLKGRQIRPEVEQLLREHGAADNAPPPTQQNNGKLKNGITLETEEGEDDIRHINRATFTMEGPVSHSSTAPITWDKLPADIRSRVDRIPKASRWIFRMPAAGGASLTITVWKQ